MTIIERARRCVETRPAAIEGSGTGNSTTFSVAALLVWGFGLAPAEALPLFLEYNARCDPPWDVPDLERMMASVLHRAHDKPRGHMVGDGTHERGAAAAVEIEPARPRRRKFELEALQRVQDPELAMPMTEWRRWLRARSTVDPQGLTAGAYLDGLYRPGEKILVFLKMWGTQGDFGRVIGQRFYRLGRSPDAQPELCDLPGGSAEGMTFLMQPVDGRWHPKVGKPELSRRTSASVTRWPYILLESDAAPLDMWLNAIVRARIRICSIASSGGRSLHALVRVDKECEADLVAELQHKDAQETLAVLGCDAQALHGMVYPRLPGTWREGKRIGKRGPDGKPLKDDRGKTIMHFVPFGSGRSMQTLLYYNPSPDLGRSIAEGVIFEREG